MRKICVMILLQITIIGYWNTSYSQIITDIPLDRQIETNVPQKQDPLFKEKKAIKISYDGIWEVEPKDSNCTQNINIFQIQIANKEINTIIGMNIQGKINDNGIFKMVAKTSYWSIEFNGTLTKKNGKGTWVKKNNPKGRCTGSITLKRTET